MRVELPTAVNCKNVTKDTTVVNICQQQEHETDDVQVIMHNHCYYVYDLIKSLQKLIKHLKHQADEIIKNKDKNVLITVS